MKKYYDITYSDISFDHTPDGQEVDNIKSNMYTKSMSVDSMANLIGTQGCSFSPAVFSIGSNKDNFVYQQLICLDFDQGVTFSEIKRIADRYRIPILFAYKTFSWSETDERFRVMIALNVQIKDAFTVEATITMIMKIFKLTDKACMDCSGLFYGGIGCLYVTDEPKELTFDELMIAFNVFMEDEYGKKHYTQKINEFYSSIGVATEKKFPVIDNNAFKHKVYESEKSSRLEGESDIKNKERRKVTRNFDYEKLYKKCRLFREFHDGTECLNYDELMLLATNLINIEKGKKVFLEIRNSAANGYYTSYFDSNWDAILRNLIDMDHMPESCSRCKYANECLHQQNMILTAKPTDSCICVIEAKSYVSLEEAEESLNDNFHKAVESDEKGFHLVIAQTGIGKTHLYLQFLKENEKKFIIAVPTHRLARELATKAHSIGLDDIRLTPELPEFKDAGIKQEIEHIYSVGAGELTIKNMWKILEKMRKDHPDYIALRKHISDSMNCFNYDGNIITTHERLFYLNRNSEVLKDHEVIIDEDIIKTMFPTCSVSNDDMRRALNCNHFNIEAKDKISGILSSVGYYHYAAGDVKVNDELLEKLNNINSNIIDLIRSSYIYNNGIDTVYIKKKWIPFDKAIVMSATADPEIYRMFQGMPVHEYRCKEAEYKGSIKVYPEYTFSRHNLDTDENVMQYVMDNINDGEIITFMRYEERFDAKYHFGAVEGLNCLEGKDINVVGLPNIDESIYKLYGLLAGVDINKEEMHPMRINYSGYDFKIHTFTNYRLRKIQLWSLYSLLEQAVGRARLLRYNCEVRVFARFPIDQADIM